MYVKFVLKVHKTIHKVSVYDLEHTLIVVSEMSLERERKHRKRTVRSLKQIHRRQRVK